MDTSNSSSPRPYDFVCGRQAKQVELIQEDWIALILDLHEALVPRLKYISGMVEFSQYMNRSQDRFHVCTRRIFFSNLPSDARFTARCVDVCSIPCGSALLKKPLLPHDITDSTKEHHHDHQIMLTSQGEFFLYHVVYSHKVINGDSHYTTSAIKVLPISFGNLAEMPLTEIHEGIIISQHRVSTVSLGAIILDGLSELLRKTIEIKRQHLEELQEILQEVETKMSRIEGLERRKLHNRFIFT